LLSPATTAAFHGPWIVACHDDSAVLTTIIQTLREAGCRVFQGYDGISCYQLALALPKLQLLVVNSRLGEMDGPELIGHIRTELPHIAVLHVGPDPDGRLPRDVPNLAEPFTATELLVAVSWLLPDRGNDSQG